MEQFISLIEAICRDIYGWFEKKSAWFSGQFQSVSDWVVANLGIVIPTLALLFLVTILYIAARNAIMPKDREGSE